MLGETITSPIEGFVTVFARDPLDVVGVYTVGPTSTSTTVPPALEMLTITPRIEFVPFATTVPSGALSPGRYYENSAKFLCGTLPTG